jgi:ATP-dependent Clp protease ATP-binding subunit ClpA
MKNTPPPPDFRTLKTRLEELQRTVEEAVAARDFEKAAALTHEKDKLFQEMSRLRAAWEIQRQMSGGTVTAQTVQETLALFVG